MKIGLTLGNTVFRNFTLCSPLICALAPTLLLTEIKHCQKKRIVVKKYVPEKYSKKYSREQGQVKMSEQRHIGILRFRKNLGVFAITTRSSILLTLFILSLTH